MHARLVHLNMRYHRCGGEAMPDRVGEKALSSLI